MDRTHSGRKFTLVSMLLLSIYLHTIQIHGSPLQKNSRPKSSKNAPVEDILLKPLVHIEARLTDVLDQLKAYAGYNSQRRSFDPQPERPESGIRPGDFSYPELSDRSWSYPEFESEGGHNFNDFDD